MFSIKELTDKFVPWMRFKKDGEPDFGKTFEALFLKTLAGKETSFSILGVRCNSKDSTGKRKMEPGQLYQFIQGYTITEKHIAVDKSRRELNVLYDDYYTELNDGKPHIQISAIVGQNGSGKSSIVEFMMRLINNFAASTIGERKIGEAAERLHYIDKIDGELWYMLKGIPYHLLVKNASVKLFFYDKCEEHDNAFVFSEESQIFDNEKDEKCEKVTEVLKTPDGVNLKKLYSHFFYTMVLNQSVYAYNTQDYYNECNSDRKECDARGDEEEKTFSDEERCWLHGIFHKNDGYKTPMVVTPYRFEGNIDINNENLLATERLVTLLATQENLRRINGHLLVKKLTYSYYASEGYRLEALQKIGFKNLTEEGFQYLRNNIISCWEAALGKKLSDNPKKRPFYEQAIDYIVYKTLKVSKNYEEHHKFYDNNKEMTSSCNLGDIREMIKKLSVDHSHITRKIFQTIAYIWYDVYDITEKRGANGELEDSYSSITFDELGIKWHRKVFKEEGAEKDLTLFYIQRQALIVPPFFCMRIDLCEEKDPSIEIDFETLSSGEKQQIYTISSILYHLDNLKSVKDDESNPERICYKNVNVILEEIELYYHPELQQQFVKYLIDSLDQVDLEGIDCINVMIITHSPYVLSDIPKVNVLALRKNNPEPESNLRTFGANIHDLLKNSFFLTEGTMGKFAQWEVGHILACMDVHSWMFAGKDLKHFPFEGIDDKEVYAFLRRYTYPDVENDSRQLLFSYEYFCKDLSIAQLKNKIQLIDEPIIYQILMKKLVELEKNKESKDAEA